MPVERESKTVKLSGDDSLNQMRSAEAEGYGLYHNLQNFFCFRVGDLGGARDLGRPPFSFGFRFHFGGFG